MPDFKAVLHSSMQFACSEWGYPEPSDSWYEDVERRLPRGLQHLFEAGLESGLLRMVDEFRFTMLDLPLGKGPYAFLSKSQKKIPSVNWEYVVQAVDYVRIHNLLAAKGYRVGVEDNLMDVTVRDRDDVLLWYVESKETASGLTRLIAEIRQWGKEGVDFEIDDRHKDGLRKAKYLLQNRPLYFSGSAIGIRLDYSVAYKEGNSFDLVEDVIPFV